MSGLWMQQALAETELAPPLVGDGGSFDAAVVGGGFCGLWTAWHLLELNPGMRIALLERRWCGSGAAGRNAGYVLDWWAKFGSFDKVCGREAAVALCRMAESSIDAIAEFCETRAPRAEFRREGWLWGASNEAQVDAWAPTLAKHRELGVELFEALSAEQIRELTGTARLRSGVRQINTGTVQPAELVVALRDALRERGVQVFENSPVRSIDDGAAFRVTTPRGRLRADRIALATSSWLAGTRLAGSRLFVVGSDIAATEAHGPPGSAVPGLGITDAAMLLRYTRTTPSGHLLVGRAGSSVAYRAHGNFIFDGILPPRRRAVLESFYRDFYPEHALKHPLTRAWTGPVDRSWTGVPFIGHAGPEGRLVYAGGFSGNGVGPSHTVGRLVASALTGREDTERQLAGSLSPDTTISPPASVTYLAGRLVRAAVRRKENAEDQGKRSSKLIRAVALLAPDAVVPVEERPESGDREAP